jgi:threonine synthase
VTFVSTRGTSAPVSFREAVFAGLAPDGGLYVPERITPLQFNALMRRSLAETGTAILSAFVEDAIDSRSLKGLLEDALDFPIPVVPVTSQVAAIELFHGPTYAFKDVGARVMARVMAHVNDGDTPITVLVATSGDTGGAVAQAFHGVEGTRVVVLFPEHGVTPVQEAQFSTLGGNVTALAVQGTFDDCQRLAKEAFADPELTSRTRLTSANSINIARLLPQAIYYASSVAALGGGPAVISVPSGNFGNLTAGVLAARLGVPIARFVAATTINDTVPRYLRTTRYEPRPSVPTLANAMDVGDPSNVERLRWLFGDDLDAFRRSVTPSVHTDDEVRATIRELSDQHGYVCDPHTAIAWLGLSRVSDVPSDAPRAFLATAHPAKFRETVEPITGRAIALPAGLAAALDRPRLVQRIAPELSALAVWL